MRLFNDVPLALAGIYLGVHSFQNDLIIRVFLGSFTFAAAAADIIYHKWGKT